MVAGVRMRKAVPPDAERIQAIAHDAYAKYVERIGRPPAPMMIDYIAVVAGGHVRVAEIGSDIAGYLIGWPEAGSYFIDNVAVAPEWQGRGLGRQLIEAAVSQARARRLPQVRLYTNAAMTENIAFYTRLGFVETHRALEHGLHRVYMRLELGDSIQR